MGNGPMNPAYQRQVNNNAANRVDPFGNTGNSFANNGQNTMNGQNNIGNPNSLNGQNTIGNPNSLNGQNNLNVPNKAAGQNNGNPANYFETNFDGQGGQGGQPVNNGQNTINHSQPPYPDNVRGNTPPTNPQTPSQTSSPVDHATQEYYEANILNRELFPGSGVTLAQLVDKRLNNQLSQYSSKVDELEKQNALLKQQQISDKYQRIYQRIPELRDIVSNEAELNNFKEFLNQQTVSDPLVPASHTLALSFNAAFNGEDDNLMRNILNRYNDYRFGQQAPYQDQTNYSNDWGNTQPLQQNTTVNNGNGTDPNSSWITTPQQSFGTSQNNHNGRPVPNNQPRNLLAGRAANNSAAAPYNIIQQYNMVKNRLEALSNEFSTSRVRGEEANQKMAEYEQLRNKLIELVPMIENSQRRQ